MAAAAQTPENVDTPQGLAFATTAFVLWGFLPFYMKAVAHIPPAEVVAHRVIWSVPLAGLVLVIMGRTADLKAALRSPRTLVMGCVTAALISVNWGIYVWSIGAGRALDAALGYYINPLFSIFLGALLLGERLNRAQMGAVVLAAMAVVVLTLENGSLPWPALGMMLTWGFYAYFKKSLPVGPNQGFMLEVLILTPPALAYLAYVTANGGGYMGGTGSDTALLLCAGLITTVPLLVFGNGAKLLRMSTVGILQYIAPTLIFLIAVLAFGEEFTPAKMIAFPMIWAALGVYSWSMLRQMRRRPA
jgi:chloramphenicol-sensitive protein RarD